MRVGYPCINTSLPCRGTKTFRLASYTPELLEKTVEANLRCLSETLEYNLKHDLLFFRITSDLVPFASHPVCRFDWKERFKKEFLRIGEFIRRNGMRVSSHPDQFVLINALKKTIVRNSVAELSWQADMMDSMKLPVTAKLQIHVGGAYGDKKSAIRRFAERYRDLPEKIKRRLAVENDDRLFDAADCLDLHDLTGVPLIFDYFHFKCLNKGEKPGEVIKAFASTWKKQDGPPIVDYSSQEPGKRLGAHASGVDMKDFSKFMRSCGGTDFDLMLEIKDKEKSALKVVKYVSEARLK